MKTLLLRYSYPISRNKLYKITSSPLKDVAMSNHPRLVDGDVVVIIGHDLFGCDYWTKKEFRNT